MILFRKLEDRGFAESLASVVAAWMMLEVVALKMVRSFLRNLPALPSLREEITRDGLMLLGLPPPPPLPEDVEDEVEGGFLPSAPSSSREMTGDSSFLRLFNIGARWSAGVSGARLVVLVVVVEDGTKNARKQSNELRCAEGR
ncbi:unnamed protein product [Dibothriocephalus latus]|uniref:Uncharacterized protein n=1 Tax=Dibothriocephalus latus TaxID=60516 RepID=A0A3P7LY69_DIBLA|nr:unnamed protein product [Dibothriocephalus latus]